MIPNFIIPGIIQIKGGNEVKGMTIYMKPSAEKFESTTRVAQYTTTPKSPLDRSAGLTLYEYVDFFFPEDGPVIKQSFEEMDGVYFSLAKLVNSIHHDATQYNFKRAFVRDLSANGSAVKAFVEFFS